VPSEGIHSWTDDGSATVPHPFALTNRFYKVRVKLPQ
jgi:hypothetical protein